MFTSKQVIGLVDLEGRFKSTVSSSGKIWNETFLLLRLFFTNLAASPLSCQQSSDSSTAKRHLYILLHSAALTSTVTISPAPLPQVFRVLVNPFHSSFQADGWKSLLGTWAEKRSGGQRSEAVTPAASAALTRRERVHPPRDLTPDAFWVHTTAEIDSSRERHLNGAWKRPRPTSAALPPALWREASPHGGPHSADRHEQNSWTTSVISTLLVEAQSKRVQSSLQGSSHWSMTSTGSKWRTGRLGEWNLVRSVILFLSASGNLGEETFLQEHQFTQPSKNRWIHRMIDRWVRIVVDYNQEPSNQRAPVSRWENSQVDFVCLCSGQIHVRQVPVNASCKKWLRPH